MEILPELVITERLTLRAWRPGEGQALHDAIVASADHLRPWMAWIAFEPQTPADRETLIVEWRQARLDGGDVVLGAWLGDAVVGGCGLHRRVGDDGLEIGYWVHVDHVGRGVATEIACGLTDAALAIPGIRRVEIHVDRANLRSQAVPARLGYVLSGEFADEVVAPGEVGVECRWVTDIDTWTGGTGPIDS